jgi:hypothetical protein
MEESPPWEANSHWGTQETLVFMKVQCRVLKSAATRPYPEPDDYSHIQFP